MMRTMMTMMMVIDTYDFLLVICSNHRTIWYSEINGDFRRKWQIFPPHV